MKKLLVLVSGFLLVLSSCSGGGNIMKYELNASSYSMKFDLKNGLYSPFIVFIDKPEERVIYNDQPILVSVRSKSTGIIETYKENQYFGQYSKITKINDSLSCEGTVTTETGSEFLITDSYSLVEDTIKIDRTITINKSSEYDEGFSSCIRFKDADSKSPSDYEYFMPAIIYKDSSHMKSGAIFSNTDLVGRIYVKETRTGLPMMLLRNKINNYSFSLAHSNISIDVGGVLGGGTVGEVNDKLKYGSIGMTVTPQKSVDYTYPCTEGPVTYDAGSTWAKRYHEVKVGNVDNYSTNFYLTKGDDYNHAMTKHYLKMYSIISPTVEDIDINKIYDDNMDIFKNEYKSFGIDKGVQYGGQPWSLALPNAVARQGYSSQMGFVGQQIPVAFQMYRYGVLNNDLRTKNNAIKALDFWSSSTINTTYFPTVWWDPSDNSSGGARREYPSFLRCMVDGMEGLLDAYLATKEFNEPKEQYRQVVERFAQNLVKKQNSNGSFYRAYNVDGSLNTDTTNPTYQGNSELNTPIAIRFLCKMYELTGDEIYKNSALKAGEFVYENLYLNLGKYVGGTPDNPNVVDKEAAVYGMYAFTSLYMLFKDSKYLEAAKHAAVCSMSWVYVYDFKVPCIDSRKSINTFINGNVKGFSFIATGHSSADNYAAYIYYELFNLYVLSGDEVFKDLSYFIQNNTKLSSDYDGRMGFKYRALMPEATIVAEFDFASVGTWLPWSSIANVEPITNMIKTYGNSDVKTISSDLNELRSQLDNYGIGGHIK